MSTELPKTIASAATMTRLVHISGERGLSLDDVIREALTSYCATYKPARQGASDSVGHPAGCASSEDRRADEIGRDEERRAASEFPKRYA